ncbi:hypothetical protein [Rhodalgimonas zhirmunskyi]|uniref:Uncharacterized protein n=1 Tax=Rhodalgimonas zhirmunskyi TaxID=2964767 RepID=A0AAJ1X3A5_9RHOB|nr:hypothetical protein [Rhodoalgimonas zhirmunskyi]MDQ2093113.1 hypothetical protein [Rhodoalgimonas zhirmunskyi]
MDHAEYERESKGAGWRSALIIAGLALPPLALNILSHFFDNPYLQPLNLTQEGLSGIGELEEVGISGTKIDVRVDWGTERTGTLTQEKFANTLGAALRSQTVYYSFHFNEVPGRSIRVTFVVGQNSYGPFSTAELSDGMKLALTAQQMTNKANR